MVMLSSCPRRQGVSNSLFPPPRLKNEAALPPLLLAQKQRPGITGVVFWVWRRRRRRDGGRPQQRWGESREGLRTNVAGAVSDILYYSLAKYYLWDMLTSNIRHTCSEKYEWHIGPRVLVHISLEKGTSR